MQNTGFQVEFLRIRWFTTVFNRTIQKWGSFRTKFLNCWFTIGMWFSLLLVLPAFGLLVKATVNSFDKTETAERSLVLEPVVSIEHIR